MNSVTALRLRAQMLLQQAAARRTPLALAALAVIVGGMTFVILSDHHTAETVTAIPAAWRTETPAPAPAAAPLAAAPVSGGDFAAALAGLSLYGTFAHQDPTTGYALLGTTRADSSLYGSGAEVVPGVLLQAVYPDHIVLTHDGVEFTLHIAALAGGPGQTQLLAVGAETPPPSAAADTLRAGPADEGEMPGIRVYPGRNRGAFAQLGLHPGDLVTAINGQVVTGPDTTDLQQLLRDAGSATVTVFRAGRLQQLSVQRTDESADGSAADSDEP